MTMSTTEFVSNLTRQIQKVDMNGSNSNSNSKAGCCDGLAPEWPCPEASRISGRRPSWQETEELALSSPIASPFLAVKHSSNSSSNKDDGGSISQLSCSPRLAYTKPAALMQSGQVKSPAKLQPASPRPNAIAFVSPFAAAAASTATTTTTTTSNSRSLRAGVPPHYSPSSCPSTPSSEAGSAISPLTAASSNGVTTPLGSLDVKNAGNTTSSMTPFEMAFHRKMTAGTPASKAGNSSSPPVSPLSSLTPRGVRSSGSSRRTQLPLLQLQQQQHQHQHQYLTLPHSPIDPMSPTTPSSPYGSDEGSSRQLRRRSVDVGMLGNARGHLKSGRTSQRDASDVAFTPPDQLRAQRAHRQTTQRNRESMFSQHLSCILSHSLSLCAAGSNEYHYDPEQELSSPGSSPRSSISDTSSSGGDSGNSLPELGDAPSHHHSSQSHSHHTVMRKHSSSTLYFVSNARRAQLVDYLAPWSFDANELDQDELLECACIVFECVLQMEGIDKSVEMNRIRQLLLSLRSAYHARNAYHNFAHAVDVLQASYAFLTAMELVPALSTLKSAGYPSSTRWTRDPALQTRGAIGDILRPMHVFALLVAAIGHDVGHPGLSNAYMVNARTPAAQVYNDKSVLENFHSVTLARMLKMHGLGFLLETETGTTEFRQVLLAAVLATDMSRHFPFVGKLTELGTKYKKTSYRSESHEDDRLLLCSGLMKCADISNPTRPHKVAKQWSTALLEEWTVQAQIEAKFKLPISVVILNPEEQVAQAKSQVGFINLFTQPLFDAMAAVVPAFQPFADSCREGRVVWESIVLNTDVTPPALQSSAAADVTPKLPSAAAFSTPSSASAASLPPSTGFSARLPPHRAPRSLKHIDANRANALRDGATPLSSDSASSLGTSPGAPSYFDRSSSISSSVTTASWLSPSTVDEVMPLGDEECKGNCSTVTALCEKCSRRLAEEKKQLVESYFGSPVEDGAWPPDPFRPRK